jgi:hypothetical protein
MHGRLTSAVAGIALAVALLVGVGLSWAVAGSTAADNARLVQQLELSHERTRARLPAADRAVLDDMCRRLAESLHRPANLPHDAAVAIARAMPGLSAGEVAALADYASGDRGVIGSPATMGQSAVMQATQQMQTTQMSFNLQYLQLQSQMQNENRSYTAVSNIMKTKHDTVKNSISNIR